MTPYQREKANHIKGGWRIIHSRRNWLLLWDSSAHGTVAPYAIFHWHRSTFKAYARHFGRGTFLEPNVHCRCKCPGSIQTAYDVLTMIRGDEI
jgi:hypothetical protein